MVLKYAYLASIRAFNEEDLPLREEHCPERGPVGQIEKLELTSAGLVVTAWLTDERVIRDVRRGTVRSFSIGAWVHQSAQDEETDTSYIKDLRLREISVCAAPADPVAKFEIDQDQGPYSQNRRGTVALAYAEQRAADLRKELSGRTFGVIRSELEKMLQLLDGPVIVGGEIASLQCELKALSDARDLAWVAAIFAAN